MSAVQRAQQLCALLDSVAKEIRREAPAALAGGPDARKALLTRLQNWQAAVVRAQDQFQRDIASLQSLKGLPQARGTAESRHIASYRMNQSLDDQAAAIDAVRRRVRTLNEGLSDLAKSLMPNRGDIQRFLAELVSENADSYRAQHEAQKQITEALAEGAIEGGEASLLRAEIAKAGKPLSQPQPARMADPFSFAVIGLIVLRIVVRRKK